MLRLPEFPDIRHLQVIRLSAIRAGRLDPREILVVLISVRGEVDPRGHSAAGRIMSMKSSIGNGTRDFPAYSVN